MNQLKKFFRTLGPGLVTGASDDDPSGIATYSQAGANLALQPCGQPSKARSVPMERQ